MVDRICNEKSCATFRRAMPMKTRLHPMSGGLNHLAICDITLLDMHNVDAWLEAIDMLPDERHSACRKILADGEFCVCNIDYKLELRCYSR